MPGLDVEQQTIASGDRKSFLASHRIYILSQISQSALTDFLAVCVTPHWQGDRRAVLDFYLTLLPLAYR